MGTRDGGGSGWGLRIEGRNRGKLGEVWFRRRTVKCKYLGVAWSRGWLDAGFKAVKQENTWSYNSRDADFSFGVLACSKLVTSEEATAREAKLFLLRTRVGVSDVALLRCTE